jgi:tetratricopeptide (TPR) repeat protein
MNKIALGMIVKATDDEAILLDNCLKNIYRHVNGIFITLNTKEGIKPSKKVIKVCEKYGAKVSYFTWIDDFSACRNYNFNQITKDYEFILWLDSDDTVDKPEKIREVIKLTTGAIDGIGVRYDYDTDEFGNVTTVHTNLRIVRNNGSFVWKAKLHETLAETRMVRRVRTGDFAVVHHASDKRKDASIERNIRIMEQMLDEEKDNVDARTLFYLGTTYVDAGRYGEAIELLEAYLKVSGWDQERAQAHVWLGRIQRDQRKDNTKAVEHFLQALYENPKEATAFVELGSVEMANERWTKAIMWLEQALIIKMPKDTSLVVNPLENTYRTYMMLAECHLEVGGLDIDLAIKLAEEALRIRPDEYTTDYLAMVKSIIKERNTTKSFINAIKLLPKEKALIAYSKLDDNYKKNPAILNAMKPFNTAKKWKQNSIVIYCGSGILKDWGPWSLDSGIGGSEEAVIRLSKHLVNLGWAVTVYNEVGLKDGVYDGVVYKNYWEFDSRDEFDVLVLWRAPFLLDAKFTTRKTYVWMHDVMDDAEFTPERLKNVDKIMLLSKYHSTVYPSIPQDKIFYTGNGIDPDDFIEEDGKHTRNPHQVVYMSSQLRGLDTLLDMWPEVLAQVPDATLKVCYGWEGYDNMYRNNPERMGWKDKIVAKMAELGVDDMGRIGQQDIVKLIQQSGVWAYPTQFPEIYCITAVKAQAGGAWPVTTDFAALAEMVQFGDKFHMDSSKSVGEWEEGGVAKFLNGLIMRLKNPADESIVMEMMTQVRNKNSWESVAQGWIEEFGL